MSRTSSEGDALDRTLVERRDPRIGTVLDQRFRIDQPLAMGGFGAIYRATDVLSDAEVALKVLHARFALDPMVGARFRREGKMLASLRDPHTVTAYEIGEAADGTLYIVMELLRGESLYERLRAGGPLPWRRALHIASGVCSSLAEAHALGMVHRDLKPANIHLEPRDSDLDFVKVLDFGIAKIVQGSEAEHTQLTQAGQMIGTLDYMSPEQMVGGELTPASDIFTLGVVIYEMITGRTPFAAAQSPTAILAAVLTRNPDPVSAYARVPAALDPIVARCLARDQSQRYGEAGDLAEALALVVADTASGHRYKPPIGFDPAAPETGREDSVMLTSPTTVVRPADRDDSVVTNPNGVARLPFDEIVRADEDGRAASAGGFDQVMLTGEATRIDVRVTDSPGPVLDARGPRGTQQTLELPARSVPPDATLPPDPGAGTSGTDWNPSMAAALPPPPYSPLPSAFPSASEQYPGPLLPYPPQPPGFGGASPLGTPTVILPPLVLGASPMIGSPTGAPPLLAGPAMAPTVHVPAMAGAPATGASFAPPPGYAPPLGSPGFAPQMGAAPPVRLHVKPSYDMTAATSYDQMVRRLIWVTFAVLALILLIVLTR